MICNSMQVVHKDKDEGGSSRGADSVGTIICARRISKHLEGEHLEGFGERRTRVQISRKIFGSNQERVRRRGRGVGKSGRVEKVRAKRKNDERVRLRVQESSKRE